MHSGLTIAILLKTFPKILNFAKENYAFFIVIFDRIFRHWPVCWELFFKQTYQNIISAPAVGNFLPKMSKQKDVEL